MKQPYVAPDAELIEFGDADILSPQNSGEEVPLDIGPKDN